MTPAERFGRETAAERAAAAAEGQAPPEPRGLNRAPVVTREYPGAGPSAGLTVVWRAELCIHSANCVRGLPQVFDPRRKPWVTPEAADAEALAATILRCPSGALQFARVDGGPPEAPDAPTTLTPIRDGPLYVRGDLEWRALDGTPLGRETRLALCRCGLARAMPRCDNSCRAAGWREPDGETDAEATGGVESSPPSADGG
jgi:uncharacterized Fe-S cluster protein YjdI/CDGSH-type Zn-finger protein